MNILDVLKSLQPGERARRPDWELGYIVNLYNPATKTYEFKNMIFFGYKGEDIQARDFQIRLEDCQATDWIIE